MRYFILALILIGLTACDEDKTSNSLSKAEPEVQKDSVKKRPDRTVSKDYQDSLREALYGPNSIGAYPSMVLQPFTRDSAELLNFIKLVIRPILKNEKQKVLSSMDFPVLAEFDTQSNVELGSISEEDFSNNYNCFFNKKLIESIGDQYKSPGDIRLVKTNDTLWYFITPQVESWSVTAQLMYYKKDDGFKLKYLLANKSDFYCTNKSAK